jgi:RNA polymerase sigma-70 factor, ECF subfamily
MHDSFVDLVDRLKEGDNSAASEVFLRFTHRLLGLARKHLDVRFSAKVDPEDVVQSAYKSFFLRHQDGDFRISSWDHLWGLLTIITVRKCADRATFFTAEKRNLNREHQGHQSSTQTPPWQQAVDREPDPEEAAILSETVEELFRSIADPDERAILELSLQGYSTLEISETTGRAERSVRRLRERIRNHLESQCLAEV